MVTAMNEYHAAMKMFPENVEMQYWTAITFANNNRLSEALPTLKKSLRQIITGKNLRGGRLPLALFTVSKEDLEKIMRL